ncbi:hypothetical protein Marky_1633 [Marinithermus hydrothermalis DSM 14884]|uniref:Uncharacterized protein n=1 Tax=Marinithermus hydrothermalis (strain DSM 14884 / JCM 11576 / T1) TaxID=869210 RepID=F2NKB9_MARHT|nr:hypothetical protein Marky_1633 [Marinithermus hydrothermalis DSM 14884]
MFLILLMLLSFLIALRGWLEGRRWAVVFLVLPGLYLVPGGERFGWAYLLGLAAGWLLLRFGRR